MQAYTCHSLILSLTLSSHSPKIVAANSGNVSLYLALTHSLSHYLSLTHSFSTQVWLLLETEARPRAATTDGANSNGGGGKPFTLNPKPSTLNSKPWTLDPKP